LPENTHNHNNDAILLPCNHYFHADCIIPWLSERQAKCPLCKYDVLDYVKDQIISDVAHEVSVWDRITRYRWTKIRHRASSGDVGVERPEVTNELELTESQRR
jgi:hypothetical protein